MAGGVGLGVFAIAYVCVSQFLFGCGLYYCNSGILEYWNLTSSTKCSIVVVGREWME